MTTSSSEALPARSPMPLTAHSTWVAPARTAASELAVARPRSLWQCTLTRDVVQRRAEPVELADEVAELERQRVADGVGHVDGRGAALDGDAEHLGQELGLGAARVHGAELDVGVGVRGREVARQRDHGARVGEHLAPASS